MSLAANAVVALIGLLHVYILVLEMFLWDKPAGRRAFGMTQEMATATKTLAANQGLYNGFLAAGLFWGLWLLPFGWLVLRSGRIPRVLGLLLVLGGIGYVVQVFGGLVPGFSDSALIGYVRLPAALGEIGSCLWLLVVGARAGRIGVSSPANP